MICVCDIGPEYFRLMGKHLLFSGIECIPLSQAIRPRSELSIRRNNTELLLVGKDGFSEFVPAFVEEVHGADLIDPFRRRVMRRVRTARHIIEEERLVR